MKEIQNNIIEYNIRFNQTELIKEETALIVFGHQTINTGDYYPAVSPNRIHNKNGWIMEVRDGVKVWATADIKVMPKQWVVEKDINHPMWKVFRKLWIGDEDFEVSREVIDNPNNIYFNKERAATTLLEQDFWNHQYLTFDQWVELSDEVTSGKYLDRLDTKGIFRIEAIADYLCKLTEISDDYSMLTGHFVRISGHKEEWKFTNLFTDYITKVTPATKEEEVEFYKNFPELEPPKRGDIGFFWDDDKEGYTIDVLSNLDCGTSNYPYPTDMDNFKNFQKLVNQGLKDEIKNFLNQK